MNTKHHSGNYLIIIVLQQMSISFYLVIVFVFIFHRVKMASVGFQESLV